VTHEFSIELSLQHAADLRDVPASVVACGRGCWTFTVSPPEYYRR